MAGMTAAFHNALRTTAKSTITHIGLVDETGTELTGGSPAYTRIAEAWADGADGVINLAENRVFNVPSGTTVGGWRGYSQLESGGTNYGGKNLTNEEFTAQGTYTLLAASTSITIANP
jgi:hypothetical protein